MFHDTSGANRGLGILVAKSLVQSGKHVILGIRGEEQGRKTASALGQETGAPERIQFIQVDVGNSESRKKFISSINKSYKGQISVLINNAGINPYDWEPETFYQAKQTNMDGPIELSLGIATALTEGGSVLNVTTAMGNQEFLTKYWNDKIGSADTLEQLQAITFERENSPASYLPSYRLTKAMLNRATQILAKMPEFKDIPINVVCPGWCRTDLGTEHAPREPALGKDSILSAMDLAHKGTGKAWFDGKPLEGALYN